MIKLVMDLRESDMITWGLQTKYPQGQESTARAEGIQEQKSASAQ